MLNVTAIHVPNLRVLQEGKNLLDKELKLKVNFNY